MSSLLPEPYSRRRVLFAGRSGCQRTAGKSGVVPVHQEPRHRLVFDSPGTRMLDVQIPPG